MLFSKLTRSIALATSALLITGSPAISAVVKPKKHCRAVVCRALSQAEDPQASKSGPSPFGDIVPQRRITPEFWTKFPVWGSAKGADFKEVFIRDRTKQMWEGTILQAPAELYASCDSSGTKFCSDVFYANTKFHGMISADGNNPYNVQYGLVSCKLRSHDPIVAC